MSDWDRYDPSPADGSARPTRQLPWYVFLPVPRSHMGPPPNPMWLYQESCAFKAATGVFIGGFVGVMMGVFFGILGADPVVPIGPGGRTMPSSPIAEQVGVAWRSLGDKAIWYCKSFSVITALFSGVDCVVEKARGKHDVLNGGLSGCATGAILAAKQGPQAAGIGECSCGARVILTTLGCAGFAAFSIAIDAVMHAQE